MATIQEPLTIAPNKKYALFPINPKYQDIWELYKRQCSSMWIPEEMDLAKDRYDFDNKLNDDERFFIKHILAFLQLVMVLLMKILIQIIYKKYKSRKYKLV